MKNIALQNVIALVNGIILSQEKFFQFRRKLCLSNSWHSALEKNSQCSRNSKNDGLQRKKKDHAKAPGMHGPG